MAITQFLRLDLRTGLLLTPGMVSDLVELERQRRGMKGDDD